MLTAIWLMTAAFAQVAPAAEPSALLKEFIGPGVRLGDAGAVKLLPPAMADGLDAAAQAAVLERVAADYGTEDFVRKSVVTPFVLKMKGLKHAQTIDVYFVSHGKLDLLAKDDLFERLTRGGAAQKPNKALQSTGKGLDATALRARGITADDGDAPEKFFAIEFAVLEQVKVSGVVTTRNRREPGSLVATVRMDPRFADDKEFPNRWRPMTLDDDGNVTYGPPASYAGFFGYVKVTPLHEPRGALFVECHLTFQEPPEWFKGNPNLLRSKLPIVIRDHVRKFRRELDKDSAGAKP